MWVVCYDGFLHEAALPLRAHIRSRWQHRQRRLAAICCVLPTFQHLAKAGVRHAKFTKRLDAGLQSVGQACLCWASMCRSAKVVMYEGGPLAAVKVSTAGRSSKVELCQETSQRGTFHSELVESPRSYNDRRVSLFH